MHPTRLEKPFSKPLTPKVGPWDGCRRQAKELSLRWADKAWTRPIVTVLLPSPSGVGVILDTHTQKMNKIPNFLGLSIYWSSNFSLCISNCAAANSTVVDIKLNHTHKNKKNLWWHSPSNQYIFAIRLGVKAVQEGESDLSFVPAVSFKLLWQQTYFLSKLIYRFWRLSPRDLDVTETAGKDFFCCVRLKWQIHFKSNAQQCLVCTFTIVKGKRSHKEVLINFHIFLYLVGHTLEQGLKAAVWGCEDARVGTAAPQATDCSYVPHSKRKILNQWKLQFLLSIR